jgi:hypothetical protein
MAGKLSNELQSVVQRTGTNTGGMRTEAERKSFSTNVRKDLASVVYQLNTVYKELVGVLSSEQNLNALDYGLSGNIMFTHIRATAASAEAYWSEEQVRARTIKETIDVLLAEIARLENEIQAALTTDSYDDTLVRALIATNGLDVLQLARDTMGLNYTLDGDGLQNLTYNLSQRLDAIGAFFTGYTGTGNTYNATLPALSFSVLLSNVTIDTTLAQSVITGLPADLGYIRAFIGMGTSGPETPTYSAHGTIVFVSDATSLEVAIQAVDAALATHAARHLSGAADEIDADKVDVDFVPSNYTRTADATYSTTTAHLAAHLNGIDLALATSASTLQNSYSNGAAGTAGDIQLTNAFGEIQILDDLLTPVNTMLRWVDAAVAERGQLRNTGVLLSNEAYLEIETLTSDPTYSATGGIYNVRPDATSADSEAWYQNSDTVTGNAQITRDGIVKELEVGHTTLFPANFSKIAADVGPVVVTADYGAGFALTTYDYDPTTSEKAYVTLPIPKDEAGNTPSRLSVTGHWVLKPTGGPYGSGAGFVVGVATSTSVVPSTIVDHGSIIPGWQADVTVANAVTAADVDTLLVTEFAEISLGNNNSLGVINLRLTRVTNDIGDDYDGDIGLIALHCVWYR